MGFSNRLKKMDEQWDGVSSGFGEVPEGMYSMQVMNAELKETRNGDLRVSVQYVIAEGEHTGEMIWDGFMLEKDGKFFESGAQFLKRWIERLGEEVPPIDEVEDTLQAITRKAPIILGEVKKNGDFTNVRMREVMGAEGPAQKPKRSAPTTAKKKEKEASPFSDGDRVTFNADGEYITGKILGMDEDTCTVLSTDDEEWEDIPLDMLEAAPEDEGPQEDEEKEEAGEDNTDLLEFIGAHDLEGADDSMDRAGLIGVIDEYEWSAKELTKDEVELLESLPITVQKPRTAKKATKKASTRGKK